MITTQPHKFCSENVKEMSSLNYNGSAETVTVIINHEPDFLNLSPSSTLHFRRHPLSDKR